MESLISTRQRGFALYDVDVTDEYGNCIWSCRPGDVLEIINYGEDWCYGRVGEELIGWIPSNCIQVEEDEQKNTPSSFWVTALYDYQASSDNELSFFQGQQIEIINYEDASWWIARIEDKEGWIPSNYIQFQDQPETEEPQNNIEHSDAEYHELKFKVWAI